MYELKMPNYIRPFFSLLFTDPTTPHVYRSTVILGNEYLCIPSPCDREILLRIAPFQSGREYVSCIWTVPLVLEWSPGCYVNLWNLMGTYGNSWELCAWELMGTYGNLWELMGTYGNLWELMGTYGNLVRGNLMRGNLWELMGTYGNLWELMGTYGNLWELNAWEPMGTYGNLVRGNLWELMGTYGN